MISMLLSEAANATQAQLLGDDRTFSGCSTDSRSLKTDQLFIALQGENFDGHEFISSAEKSGAAAALVQKDYDLEHELALIKVADTRKAMGWLAKHWRSRLSIPLVAVTGSNGKTTVKEMLSSVLSQQESVLVTKGNLNNDIGVPLTLFGLGDEHQYAVIEMGANHAGEIEWLTEIASPSVALITQCAPAHLEGFGSIDGVAKAKAEIFSGLQKDGVAIINADDNYSGLWREKAAVNRQISFALHAEADVTAKEIELDSANNSSRFILNTSKCAETVNLPLLGEHNVANALATTACCLALDLPLSVVKTGLERMQAVKGRLQLKKGIHDVRIIDDTYNANPTSLSAAIKVACAYTGPSWLVLGDMGELGASTQDLHYGAGEIAREMGIKRLYAVGSLSQQAVRGFGEGAQHFSSMEELISELLSDLNEGLTLLIKGSRSMAMERVVNALQLEAE